METSNPRLFSPTQQTRFNPSIDPTSSPDSILSHDVATGTRHLLMYALAAPDTPRVVKNSLVVSIAADAQVGTWGVFFATESALNARGTLPPESQTSRQRAALWVLEKALGLVESMEIGIGRGGVEKVVVMTTAKEVAAGLSEGIWEWEYNGYKDVQGRPVGDGDVFREVHGRIGRLEGRGVDVCFWVVGKGENGEAEDLAAAAA